MQCDAVIYKRDAYRSSNHGKSFRMHYRKCQCARKTVADSDFCWQHGSDRLLFSPPRYSKEVIREVVE